jgi:regulator of sirC expression with transglutaminase-like and TPR domain
MIADLHCAAHLKILPPSSVNRKEGQWWDAMSVLGDDSGGRVGEGGAHTLAQWIDQGSVAWHSEQKPKWRIRALNRLFFSDLQLKAVSAVENPLAMYVQTVLDRRIGNCLGLSALYLLVAEALGIPLVPILATRHVFVRYDDGKHKQNIETTRRGRDLPDPFYGDLRVLSKREFVALMLVTRAAYAHAPQARWDLAERDLAQAVVLFPDCEYAYLNLAIVRRRLGYEPETNAERLAAAMRGRRRNSRTGSSLSGTSGEDELKGLTGGDFRTLDQLGPAWPVKTRQRPGDVVAERFDPIPQLRRRVSV